MIRVLLSGGAGFIGHHLVDHLLRTSDCHITIIDRLDISGNLNRLAEVGAAKNPRVRWVYHDLKAPISDQLAQQLGEFDYILHLAAATHVDRSIADPLSFVMDNVVGTCTVLDFARRAGCGRFLQFSTDEIHGPAPPGVAYREDDRYHSGNPYAATKAGAEQLALSYHNTFRVPVMVTRTMNVVGIRQHAEKMVPGTIARVRDGKLVTIHADPTCTKPGSRFYIGADQVASAVTFLLAKGSAGEVYNVVGSREMDNLELAQLIADAQRRPLIHELVNFHGSRPGHDLRYALDGSKLASLGWTPAVQIEETIRRITEWSLDNPQWLLGN